MVAVQPSTPYTHVDSGRGGGRRPCCDGRQTCPPAGLNSHPAGAAPLPPPAGLALSQAADRRRTAGRQRPPSDDGIDRRWAAGGAGEGRRRTAPPLTADASVTSPTRPPLRRHTDSSHTSGHQYFGGTSALTAAATPRGTDTLGAIPGNESPKLSTEETAGRTAVHFSTASHHQTASGQAAVKQNHTSLGLKTHGRQPSCSPRGCELRTLHSRCGLAELWTSPRPGRFSSVAAATAVRPAAAR